jgi:proteasome alpha subunit
MSMPFYASAEQVFRDRSEYARKNIARGRDVVVLTYSGGVLFVAENSSNALHKVGEIYDRIGFAAVGRYNEFDNLRAAGIRYADLRGYSYDRQDVSGRALANVYSQTLAAVFTDQQKPFEVELCVAEVGETPAEDQLYRLTFDGSVNDFDDLVVIGGQADAIQSRLRESYRADATLDEAIRATVAALAGVGGDGGSPREITAAHLEVAILDRARPLRKFRRINAAALTQILTTAAPDEAPAEPATESPTESPGEAPTGAADGTPAEPPGESPAGESADAAPELPGDEETGGTE